MQSHVANVITIDRGQSTEDNRERLRTKKETQSKSITVDDSANKLLITEAQLQPRVQKAIHYIALISSSLTTWHLFLAHRPIFMDMDGLNTGIVLIIETNTDYVAGVRGITVRLVGIAALDLGFLNVRVLVFQVLYGTRDSTTPFI